MSKKNLILGGILIVLVGLAYLYQGPLRNWQEKEKTISNFLSEIDVQSISSVEITRDNAAVSLIKSGDKWKVGGTKDFYVKASVAEDLNRILGEMARAELEVISNNPGKKSEFRTDAGGIQVALRLGENKMAEFIVGKTTSDYLGTYLSRPDDDATYILNKSVEYVFSQEPWEDDTIFSGDKEKITSIRFQYPRQEFTVEKKDGEWEGTKPYKFTVSEEKIDPILDLMSNLVAVAIPAQSFAGTGLEKNLIIVQATSEGIDNTLMVGEADDEGRYYVKRGNSDNIYLITEDQRDLLEVDMKKLR